MVNQYLTNFIQESVLVNIFDRYELWIDGTDLSNDGRKINSRFIKHFIWMLIQLNIHAVTACLQDATAITPFALAHKKDVKPLLRNKFQSYAAMVGSSIIHLCMTTSHDIVHATTHSSLGIASDLNDFWKYVVTECADARIGKDYKKPSSRTNLFNRTIRADGSNNGNTVFEYFFKGAGMIQRFQGARSTENYFKGFRTLLVDSLNDISDMLDGGHGIAMYMFVMENKSTQIDTAEYSKHLRTIPTLQRTVAETCRNRGKMSLDKLEVIKMTQSNLPRRTLVKQGKLFARNAIEYFDQMSYILVTHEERYRSKEWIMSSSLNIQSAPGEWASKMRAKNHKAAAQMILRLPLMLNGMAPSHCRSQVQFILKTLLAEPDPLHPRVKRFVRGPLRHNVGPREEVLQ
jgi:hypothetical protein